MYPNHPVLVFVHHTGDVFVNMVTVDCDGTKIVLGMDTDNGVMRISDSEDAVKADSYLNDIPCIEIAMPKIS